jgi:hypothetical protein
VVVVVLGAASSLPFSYGNCHMSMVASLPHPVVVVVVVVAAAATTLAVL